MSWQSALLRGITALPVRPRIPDDLGTFGSDVGGYTGQGPLTDPNADSLADPTVPTLLAQNMPQAALPPRPPGLPQAPQAPAPPPPQAQGLPPRPGTQTLQFPQMGTASPSQAAPPSANSDPQPDPMIRQIAQRSMQPPPLPPRPGVARSILGGLAGMTRGGQGFAPLIDYGPKGLQQIQQYQQYQQQLPEQIKAGQLVSEDQNRVEQARQRVEAQKQREQAAVETERKNRQAEYDAQANNIRGRSGYLLSEGEKVPEGYVTQSVTNPAGRPETWVTPTHAQVLKEAEEAKHAGDVPLGDEVTTALGLPSKLAVPDMVVPHILESYRKRLEELNPDMNIQKVENEVSGDVTMIYSDKKGKVVKTEVIPGAAKKRPQQININNQQATDPNFLEGAADAVFQNPRAFESYQGAVKNAVGQAFTKKYGLPPPGKISQQLEDRSELSGRALEQLATVRTLLADPVVQQRLGPVMGRLGNAEQDVGATAGLPPADAQKIQNVRSALNYLVFGEGNAIFGARIPQQLMESFKSTAPNVRESGPLLAGSLDAANEFANSTITAAEKARFGGKTRAGFKPGQAMGAGGPAGATIRVKRKSDGATGNLDPKDFDPAKYDKL